MGSDEARALKVTRGWVAAVAVALAVLAFTSAVLEVQVHRLQGEVRNAQDRMVVPHTPADPASADNARGLCRVLGALAKSQGVHLDRVSQPR